MKPGFLLLAVGCGVFVACDFDASRGNFCSQRGEVCSDGGESGGDGGGSGGDGGEGADAGGGDSGFDAGFDGGGEPDAGGDVDGGADAGPGAPAFARVLGGEFCTNAFNVSGVGQNAAGQVVAAGMFSGDCDVGADASVFTATAKTWVTRFEPGGQTSAQFVYGPTSGSFLPTAAAIGPSGALAFSAQIGDSTSLYFAADAGCVEGPGAAPGSCIVQFTDDGGVRRILRLDSNGMYPPPENTVTRVVIGADDTLAFGGKSASNFFFPGCPSKGNGGYVPNAWYVGHVSPDGGNCWAYVSTCAGGARGVEDVLVDPANGDVYVLGKALGWASGGPTCDLYDNSSNVHTVTMSGPNYVVARYDAQGAVQFAREVAVPAGTGPARLALSGANLYFAAEFSGTILQSTFDGGVTSAGGQDLLLLQLQKNTGVVLSSFGYRVRGGSLDDTLVDFGAGADSGVWLVGRTTSPEGVDFGGGALVPDGGFDRFVVHLSAADLSPLSSRMILGNGPSTVTGFSANGPTPALGGVLKGTLDLGSGPISDPSSTSKSGYVGTIKEQ